MEYAGTEPYGRKLPLGFTFQADLQTMIAHTPIGNSVEFLPATMSSGVKRALIGLKLRPALG